MLEHLRPEYSKSFRCIGSDCEDTCCHGMDVVIDKAAYERYESTPRLEPVMQHLVRITDRPTAALYARIQLTPAYSCPFLSRDRLCNIQQEYGERYLADICASFPRVKRSIDDLEETVLLLSCPEAARLVLLNPNLLGVDRAGGAVASSYDALLQIENGKGAANGSPHRYLWELRSFTLTVLQDRNYPLWQRVFVLGMFCKRLDELIKTQQMELVPKLLGDFAGMMVQGGLRPSLDGVQAQIGPQLTAIVQVLQRHHDLQGFDPSHQRFRDCIQDFLRGLNHQPGDPIETCVQAYTDAHERYYLPFMQERPFILENYLINHVFKTRFPFGVNARSEPNSPLTDYLILCVQFAAVKGLLIGMAGYYKTDFSEAHVVKLVQSFSKAVEHYPDFFAASNLGLAIGDAMGILLRT